MTPPSFAAGDTVKLKSGGPVMVIKEVRSESEIVCQWIDDKKKPQEQIYSAVVLMPFQYGIAMTVL